MPLPTREIRLVQTCEAWPEQYDAFFEDVKVGYLRLRHGVFTVQAPDVYGEILLSTSSVDGDGEFSESEREYYLDLAKKFINQWLDNQSKK